MLSSSPTQKYFTEITKFLASTPEDQLYQAIADAPFKDKFQSVQLDLGIVALLIVDNSTKLINRIAMSNTELAQGADAVSAKPFHEMSIPLDHKGNLIAKAVRTNKVQQTLDWKDLFAPVLQASDARFNQAAGGIGSSIIAPFDVSAMHGAIVFDFYQPIENIGDAHYSFIERYMNIVTKFLSK